MSRGYESDGAGSVSHGGKVIDLSYEKQPNQLHGLKDNNDSDDNDVAPKTHITRSFVKNQSRDSISPKMQLSNRLFNNPILSSSTSPTIKINQNNISKQNVNVISNGLSPSKSVVSPSNNFNKIREFTEKNQASNTKEKIFVATNP